MSDVSGQAAAATARLGLHPGDLVGELGYDDDVDAGLRAGIESTIGSELLGGDADDVLDAVLVWWRSDDGDLTDELVDAITLLADDGVVLLATPRAGRDGYVDPGDIGDAASTAGFGQTTNCPPFGTWMTTKLMRSRPGGRSRR